MPEPAAAPPRSAPHPHVGALWQTPDYQQRWRHLLAWLDARPGKDYTQWRPFRMLTALASGGNAYLAPLLASA